MLTATTYRSVLRDALKRHKRLSAPSQQSNLSTITEALNAYVPYLLVLDASLNNQRTAPTISISPTSPFQSQWRPTLTRPSNPALREPDRVTLNHVSEELAFVLQTLAYIQVIQSRTALLPLYASSPPPSQEQRTLAIGTAMKYLLEAHSIHAYTINPSPKQPKAIPVPKPDTVLAAQPPLDVSSSTQIALTALAWSEATLLSVLQSDPYIAAVLESRSATSKEWMISAPHISKVRIGLLARLCLRSAECAAKASGSLAQNGQKTDEDLLKYTDNLRRTARAKAARFLGIDAEASGKTGEGIAWLKGARRELGYADDDTDGLKRRGFKGLRQTWAEKREDKRLLKGDSESWGMDAGKLEEARVVEWLEGKWTRENEIVVHDFVPPYEPLLAGMPSGRDFHSPKAWVPPALDEGVLESMRVMPDSGRAAFRGTEEDSGDEDGRIGGPAEPVGAFPGTGREYSTDTPAYY